MLNVRLPDRHLVVELQDGRLALLDTGSPITICKAKGKILFGQGSYQPAIVLPGFIDQLNGLIPDYQLDAVIGNDALSLESFLLTVGKGGKAATIQFPTTLPSVGLRVVFNRRMSIPMTQVELGPHRELVTMVVDTGAVISIAPTAWLKQHGGKLIGCRHEFIPTGLDGGYFSEFETGLYEVPLRIDGQDRILTMGHIPEPMERGLHFVMGTSFMLGTDLLLQQSVLIYDAQRKQFVLTGERLNERDRPAATMQAA